MGEEDDGTKKVGIAEWEAMADRAESFFGLDRTKGSTRFEARALGESDEEVAALETRVAAMRRLGVTKWDGIELGPAPTVPLPEVKARPPNKGEVHLQFWSKLRRSSGARIPACSAQCACGAWRMIDGQDGDLGD